MARDRASISGLSYAPGAPFGVEVGRTPETGTELTRAMIDAFKSDDIVNKIGGRFKLCSLIQRRLVQLMEGARPMVDRAGRTDLEIVVEEILQEKIGLDFDASQLNGAAASA